MGGGRVGARRRVFWALGCLPLPSPALSSRLRKGRPPAFLFFCEPARSSSLSLHETPFGLSESSWRALHHAFGSDSGRHDLRKAVRHRRRSTLTSIGARTSSGSGPEPSRPPRSRRSTGHSIPCATAACQAEGESLSYTVRHGAYGPRTRAGVSSPTFDVGLSPNPALAASSTDATLRRRQNLQVGLRVMGRVWGQPAASHLASADPDLGDEPCAGPCEPISLSACALCACQTA